ncbi:MAG: hypothetical protein RR942_17920 [Romboutsia sp.]
MEKDLFFVNDILLDEHEKSEIRVNLFKILKSEDISEVESIVLEHNISNSRGNDSLEKVLEDLNIKEGSFVYLENKCNHTAIGTYIPANKDIRAKTQILNNNNYRGKLIKKYTKPEKYDSNLTSDVYSYHINVGHGNCSIIVFKENDEYKIWMIDCSEFDFRNKVNYRKNIQSCFKFIKSQLNIDFIKIDKLFVTHPHYDHFNGINNLIDQEIIDRNTEIWINLNYSWPETKYNLLLEKLTKLNLNLIEPISSNSTEQIEILYPNKTILRTKPKNINVHSTYDIVPANKVNNSSVVFKFNLGEKSMVFPGDLEEKGWDKVNTCSTYLKGTTYYCISHHGSITGHRRSTCPHNNQISNIEFCCSKVPVNILMGREGAYTGIFSDEVLQCFKNRVYRTDKHSSKNDPEFIQINWQSESVVYY